MKCIIFAAGVFCAAVGPLMAGNVPTWWSAPSTSILQSGATANNYAPANLGQLKYVAFRAKAYLDANLSGGAGATINSLVASFKPQAGVTYTAAELAQIKRDNYAPINVGQLKAVANIFYSRLVGAGYFTRISLIAHGYPGSWAYDYPWNTAAPAPVAQNYVLANLGQLKVVFSFDLADADSDGLPDSYESAMTGSSGGNGSWLSILSGDGFADADGDGISDLAEYQIGWNANSNDLNNTTETESLTYDGAHRLTNVTGRSTLGYTLDAGGNLLQSN